MLQLGTDLLEDKRTVAIVYQIIQELLGITQQEPVGFLVEFSYLLLDVAEQSKLIQMLECTIGREVYLPLLHTDTFCFRQQRYQGAFCQRKNGAAVRTALTGPLLTISKTFLHRSVVAYLITEVITL